MRQALDKWIGKNNESLIEWKEICGKLANDNTDIQSVCLKFAELYESKKIPESELLASLSHVTGKTLDQIDTTLREFVSANVKPTAEEVAKKFGITFNGIQDLGDEETAYTFTDNNTHGTFLVVDLNETEMRLNAMRKEFEDGKKDK